MYQVGINKGITSISFNPLNAKLNPICHLQALLGAHHSLHFSRIRVKCVIADSVLCQTAFHSHGINWVSACNIFHSAFLPSFSRCIIQLFITFKFIRDVNWNPVYYLHTHISESYICLFPSNNATQRGTARNIKITQLNGVNFSLGINKILVITFSGVDMGFQYSVSALWDASEVV